MAAEVRTLGEDVATWRDKASHERTQKEALMRQLDKLAEEGEAAVAAEFGDSAANYGHDLMFAVQSAVADWAPAADGGRSLTTHERLVETIARTTVMSRQIQSLAGEVESTMRLGGSQVPPSPQPKAHY
jgi:hypothetical protein